MNFRYSTPGKNCDREELETESSILERNRGWLSAAKNWISLKLPETGTKFVPSNGG